MIDPQKFICLIKAKLGPDNMSNAMAVLKLCMEQAERFAATGSDKAALVKTVLGAPEFLELLPPPVSSSIRIMVENGLVDPTLDAICQAAQGKFNLNKTALCCATFVQKWLAAKQATKAEVEADAAETADRAAKSLSSRL
jgi:hypothetical protein